MSWNSVLVATKHNLKVTAIWAWKLCQPKIPTWNLNSVQRASPCLYSRMEVLSIYPPDSDLFNFPAFFL